MIHELLHVGSSTNLDYSHYQMFKAAYAVAERQGGEIFSDLKQQFGDKNPCP